MSLKTKIRDLKTDKCEFEIYLVKPEKGDNFNISYVLAVPKNIKNGTRLIVESNNKERYDNGKEIDYETEKGKKFLERVAIDEILYSRVEMAKTVEAPFIIPIIPAIYKNSPYYQQLSREAIVDEDTNSDMYRVDNQLCEIIEDTKRIISEDKGVELAEKIFLNGYSSSGVFAQRFAFLHPEIIDTALIGGAGGSIPMPIDCKASDELEYPLGTKDYKQVTGRDFDLESYKKINFQYYLAEFEEFRKSEGRRNEFGFKAPMHDMSYMDKSVPVDIGKEFRKIFGINLWKRFIKQIAEYEKNGYKINAEIYKGRLHTNSLVSLNDFEKVYEGPGFSKTSKDIQKSMIGKYFNTFVAGINRIKGTFKRHKSLPEKNDTYLQKVESIDADGLVEEFEEKITQRGLDSKIENLRKKYESKLSEEDGIYNYPLQTKLNQEQVIELTQKFFKTIDKNLSSKVNDILSGKTKNSNGKFIDLQNYPYHQNLKYYQTKYDTNSKGYGTRSTQSLATWFPNNDVMIYVPLRGNLSDLYSMVHELTHSFDTDKGNTATRKVVGEVLPQCMERMLDEFLLNLSLEEKQKYGIDTEVLENDIKKRKITTFISRYDNIVEFYNGIGNKVKDLRYILAQIYSTQFMKNPREDRINIIKNTIKCIQNDDFVEFNKYFGMKIEKSNQIDRRNCIDMTLKDFTDMIFQKSDEGVERKHRSIYREMEQEK